jgi:hypothetical protein
MVNNKHLSYRSDKIIYKGNNIVLAQSENPWYLDNDHIIIENIQNQNTQNTIPNSFSILANPLCWIIILIIILIIVRLVRSM